MMQRLMAKHLMDDLNQIVHEHLRKGDFNL